MILLKLLFLLFAFNWNKALIKQLIKRRYQWSNRFGVMSLLASLLALLNLVTFHIVR